MGKASATRAFIRGSGKEAEVATPCSSRRGLPGFCHAQECWWRELRWTPLGAAIYCEPGSVSGPLTLSQNGLTLVAACATLSKSRRCREHRAPSQARGSARPCADRTLMVHLGTKA